MKTITEKQLEKLPHKFQVAFALFCAKQVSHLNTDERVDSCIEIVEKWLKGKVAADAAADAAAAAARAAYAAADAAYAAAAAARAAYAARAADAAYAAAAAARAAYAARAADAARAAAYAARAAAADAAEKLIEEQNRYYEELLNFDNIVERELLDENNN